MRIHDGLYVLFLFGLNMDSELFIHEAGCQQRFDGSSIKPAQKSACAEYNLQNKLERTPDIEAKSLKNYNSKCFRWLTVCV